MGKFDEFKMKYGLNEPTEKTGKTQLTEKAKAEDSPSKFSQFLQRNGYTLKTPEAETTLPAYTVPTLASLSINSISDPAVRQRLAKIENGVQKAQYRKEQEQLAPINEEFIQPMQKLQNTLASYSQYGASGFATEEGYRAFTDEIERLRRLAEGRRVQYYGDAETLKQFDKISEQLNELSNYARYQRNKMVYAQQTVADSQTYLQLQEEIDKFEAVKAEYEECKSLVQTLPTSQSGDASARMAQIYQQYGDLDALLSEKKARLAQLTRSREADKLSAVIKNSDFDEHSSYVSTECKNGWNKLWSRYGMGYDDLTYEYINGSDNGMRRKIIDKAIAFSSDTNAEAASAWEIYDYLTADEIKIYNYYYAKEGQKAAERYLDSIRDNLNYRMASGMYENMQGNVPLELAFGVTAGVDQFKSGVQSFLNFNDDYVPASATQMASGMVRDDLGDSGFKLPDWLGGASLGQAAYDTVTTTSNMLPSIMLSTYISALNPVAGQITGTLLMGASAAGNAYQEMLNLGYSKGQARAYSSLIGASEAGLQYLLGGVGKLGGKLSGNVMAKMISGIDNAFARISIELGGKMLSEGMEEGLQEILTPWFKNLALHADEDVNWSEVAYSSLLGALSAGLMEGGSAVSTGNSRENSGNSKKGDVPNDITSIKAQLATQSVVDATAQTPPSVSTAVDTIHQGGTVSNSMAERILADPQAVELLTQRTGMILPETQSARRAAVKAAVAQLAAYPAVDTAPQTGYDNQNTTGGTTYGSEIQTQAPVSLRRGEASIFEAQGSPSAQTGNRSGISGQMGENDGALHTHRTGERLRDGLTASQEPLATPKSSASSNSIPSSGDNVNRINDPNRDKQVAQSQENNHGGSTNEQSGYKRSADAGILSGGQGRQSGSSSGRSAGSMAGGAVRTQAETEQSATASSRQSAVHAEGIREVSAASLGVQDGSRKATLRVMPEKLWDDAMRATADRIYENTGKRVTFVVGALLVDTPKGAIRANGVWTNRGIIIQADHMRFSIDQIADHEIFHDMAFRTPWLVKQIEDDIRAKYDDGELNRVIDSYTQKLALLPENATQAEIEEVSRHVVEEIMADAYAGVNRFSADAAQFHEDVTRHAAENFLPVEHGQENGVRETNAPPADRYSIDNISGENSEYGIGVHLDTDIFDGVKPSAWGRVLGSFVYKHLAGTEVTIYDEHGSPETIYLARLNDRVRKDGASNSRKVIDKLARYRGDNIRALSTVHLSELLATSRHESSTSEHSHQWMDENGWEYRKTYIQDRYGKIYEATLNIANGRDRRILYDINNIRQIDKERTVRGVVPSTNEGRGSLTKDSSYPNMLSDDSKAVKGKFMADDEGSALYNQIANSGEQRQLKRKGGMKDTEIKAVQSVGRKSVNDFSATEVQKTEGLARRYWAEMREKSPFFRAWFGDWRAYDQSSVQIANKAGDTRGVQRNKDTGWDIQVSGKVFNETNRHTDSYNVAAQPYLGIINDIVKNAVLLDTYGVDQNKIKSPNSLLMHSLYAVADIGNGPEIIKLYVEEMNNPNSAQTGKRAYQLQNVEKYQLQNGSSQNTASSISSATGAIRTVADLFAAVKSRDSHFNPKSVNRNLINADGTPVVLYHGTSDRFTQFKESEIAPWEGSFFFAQNREDAKAYSGNGTVMEVYVSLQNPIDYNDMPSEIYRLKDKKAQVEALKKLGYDGWYCDMDTGWGEVSAFYPEQIKSATDNMGTFDGRNPDIRYMEDDSAVDTLTEEERQRVDALKDVPEYRPGMKEDGDSAAAVPDEEFIANAEKRAIKAKADLMRNIPKEDFRGTDALERLGIKVENSVGNYSMVKAMIANDRSAKEIIREMRKAEKRLDATAGEKNFAAGIASGYYQASQIPSDMDADKVLELADYLWAVKAISGDLIQKRRADIAGVLYHKMDRIMRKVDTADIRLPKAFTLHHRSAVRNMTTIFGAEVGEQLNDFLFHPVATNEAERYRFMNRMYNEVRRFEGKDGIKKKLTKRDRALVQMVIEGRAVEEAVAGMEMRHAIKNAAHNIRNGSDAGDAAREFSLTYEERKLAIKYSQWMNTLEALEDDAVDAVRIDHAVKKYSELFDQFYEAINDFLVAHGYEPIGYIKGYAPHMQPDENHSALRSALEKLGLSPDVSKLPTSIAGLTKDYKPNRRWNPFFLSRQGDATSYDIVTAFESYVDYMSDVIYHTDDIMRVRQAAEWFRKTYAPEQNRELIDQALELRYSSMDEKLAFLREHEQIGLFGIPSAENINEALDAYISKLFENLGDKTVYSDFVMWLDDYANKLAGKQLMADRDQERTMGRTSLNLVNKASRWFTRAQVAGNLSSALNQSAQLPQIIGENGFRCTSRAIRDMVSFKLRNTGWYQDSDFLTEKKGIDYIANTPGEMIISGTFKPLEIMDHAMSTLAVRGRYLKEIKAGKSHAEAMKIADRFGRSVMGSRAKGSIPLAFQQRGVVSQFFHTFQVEAANSWEHIIVDLPQDFRQIQQEQGVKAAAGALAGVIIKTLLTAFLLNRFSEELYGGTPAPFDILGLTANFIASGQELSTNDFLLTVMDNCWETVTGERIFHTEEEASLSDGEFDWGAALSDTWYNVSNDIPYLRNAFALLGWGDDTLPLPDLVGAGKDITNALTDENAGLLSYEMGQALLGLAGDFIPGGRQLEKTASGLETAIRGGKYKGMGDNTKLQYPVDVNWDTAIRLAMFGDAAAPERQGFYASGDSALSAKQTETYDALVDSGADAKMVYDAIQEYRRTSNDDTLTSVERGKKCRDVIRDMDMSDEQKLQMYSGLTNAESTIAKFQLFMDEGMSWDSIMDVYDKHSELKADEDLKESEKATQFARWVDGQGYPAEQTDIIKDQLLFWNMVPAQASTYEKFVDTGMDPDDAYELVGELGELEPVGDADDVTALQKWRTCVDFSSNEHIQMSALAGQMTPEQFAKVQIAYDFDVSPDVYITFKEKLAAVTDGRTATQEDVERAINRMRRLSTKEKAVLWQLAVNSNSAKNNPFSERYGEKVLEEKQYAKRKNDD